jgi:hypothetical protein
MSIDPNPHQRQEADRADYLILLNGGSMKRLCGYTEEEAKNSAELYASRSVHVTLVKIIGTVEVVTKWKDAE